MKNSCTFGSKHSSNTDLKALDVEVKAESLDNHGCPFTKWMTTT